MIGAVDGCRVSNMPAHDATADIVAEYSQPLELTGTGEIVEGKVHCTLYSGAREIRLSPMRHTVKTFITSSP